MLRRHLLTSSALPVVLLTGCGVTYGDQRLLTQEPMPPLIRSGGCGEALLWAADDEGRTAVVVTADLRDRSTPRVEPPVEGGGEFAQSSLEATHLVAEDGRVLPDAVASTAYIGFRAG